MKLSIKKFLTVTSLALFMTGCASTSIKGTSEADRDMSRKYDGSWAVKVKRNPETQYIQNWNVGCANMAHDKRMTVVDGKVIIFHGSKQLISYVSKDGKFRTELPLNSKTKESGISDISITDGTMKLIVTGNLNDDKGTGYYTVGIAQFAYDGCKAKIQYSKI